MDTDSGKTLLARFYTPEGESMGPPMSVPSGITVDQLSTLLNDHVLKNVRFLFLYFVAWCPFWLAKRVLTLYCLLLRFDEYLTSLFVLN